ncbi:MAG TPA: ATP-binding protein [Acidobacteriota bacterium]|nr:ATP-binding protein [Acidobacteriota bacterium]
MTSERTQKVSLTIASDIALLDLVQEVTAQVGKLTEFTEDDLFWVGLDVREAVSNAIEHGNRGDVGKPVHITFEWTPGHLRVSVRDEGKGIDESALPDPLAPDNLLKPKGRGVFFVRSFMDKVRFHVLPEGGHEVVMDKWVKKQDEGENYAN